MNLLLKTILSWTLVLAAFFAMPAYAQAKVKKHDTIRGKVTEVNKTSITVSHTVNGLPDTTTVINVPTGTPITDKKTGAAVLQSDLVGKNVKVKESGPGIAASIVVKGHKHKAKNTSA